MNGRGVSLWLLAALGLHAADVRAHPGPDGDPDDDAEAEADRGDQASEAAEPDGASEAIEIVVEAPRTTALTTRITPEQLAAAPIRTAEDALRLAPGLVLVQHGAEGKGQQYFLRGFDAVHGLDFEVEVDGVPLNEWSNIHAQGYLDLGLMIPELISGVEVLPGPFDLDQGPFGVAGSARFRLAVPQADRGLRATIGFGSTKRVRTMLSYSPRDGDGTRFIAAELLGDSGYGEARDSRRAVVMLRQQLFATTHGRMTATVIGHAAEFGLPGTTSLREYEAGRIDFWGAHDGGRGSARRAHAALDWTTSRTRWSLRALAWSGYRRLWLIENFTGSLERPEQGDRRVQRHDAIPFGLRLDQHVHLGRRVELRAGLGVRGDAFEQSEDRVDLERRPFEGTRDLAAVQLDGWALVGLRWRATERLELGAGSRFDVFGFSVRDRLVDAGPVSGVAWAGSPRVHLRWDALDSLQLFMAYGRGFRPPEARAFVASKPETMGISSDVVDEGPRVSDSDSGELGLRWRPERRVSLHLAGFATYIDRESIYDHVSRTNLQLSATRRFGAELGLDARPLAWLGLSGSVTWVDARFVASRNPVPLAPNLVGSVRAWIVHQLGARAGLSVVGWAPRPLPYGARGSGLVRVDATAGWHLERVRVDLTIENVLGLRLREGEYYFASNFQYGQPASRLPTLHYVPGPPLNARLSVSLLW